MESTPTLTDAIRASPGSRAAEAEPASLLRTWLWQPNPIVFISSACIMILKLVAGWIIAPYVRVSLVHLDQRHQRGADRHQPGQLPGRVAIATGASNDAVTEVTAGLEEGDAVMTNVVRGAEFRGPMRMFGGRGE